MLLQLKKKSGYDAYITKETYDILRKMFTKESIELPVLEETFCDINKMKFQVHWQKSIASNLLFYP